MKWGVRRTRIPAAVQAANGLAERIAAAQLPRAAGSWRIAVMGPKGGSGKTPTAAALGLNLAGRRGEITAVVGANTHLDTLRRRLVPDGHEAPMSMLTMATLAPTGQLAPEWPVLSGYCDLVDRLRVFTNTGVDPALVEHMTGEQYSDFLALLSRAAQLVVSDMGTSAAGEVAIAALDSADQLVLCTELRRDALELAVEWLSALCGEPVSYRADPEDYSSIADGRYVELARRAIVVVAPGGGDRQALTPLLEWFAEVTNAGRDVGRVVVVPYDAHIARGERILLDQLDPDTGLAYLQVAAHVVDNFSLGQLGTRRLPPAPAVLPQLAVQSAHPVIPAPVVEQQPVAGRPEVAAAAAPLPGRTRPGWPPSLGRPAEATAAPVPAAPQGVAAVARPVSASGPAPSGAAALQMRRWPLTDPAETELQPAGRQAPPVAAPDGVAGGANLALGRDLAGVLGVEHTEGEVCTGCAVRGCSWPVPPLTPAGAGQRT